MSYLKDSSLEEEFDSLCESHSELEYEYAELRKIIDDIKSICDTQPASIISASATDDNVTELVTQMSNKLTCCLSVYNEMDDLFGVHWSLGSRGGK